jgi:hypothetical protein
MTASASNAIADPTATLQSFTLADLAQYTSERAYAPDASTDFKLFFVGRDDVHDILKHMLSRVTTSCFLNMFGYDDDELNDILMAHAMNPNITMTVTLDKSQAGGVHEAKLLAADRARLAGFNTHFVVGQSATHQISHTKGGVLDGRVAFEGSTNWSASGEGTFVVAGKAGGVGYKAQNNTLGVIQDRDTIARFQAELIQEHLAAQAQAAKAA